MQIYKYTLKNSDIYIYMHFYLIFSNIYVIVLTILKHVAKIGK